MPAVEGVKELTAKLKALPDKSASVVVGYTQAYALYVHEDLEAHHPVGQAKFLEEPARTNASRLAAAYVDARRRGLNNEQALLLCALMLQRESQKLCPVDTGALRASAFTRADSGGAASKLTS